MTDPTTDAPVKPGPLFMIMGVVNVILGFVVLFWPDATLRVVVILVGLQLIFVGAIRIFVALAFPEGSPRFLAFLVGLLGIVAGLLVMRDPLQTVALVVTLLGIFWVFAGLAGVISSFMAAPGEKMGMLISAVVTLALGALLLGWPEPTLRVVAVVVALFLIVQGVAEVAVGVAARKGAVAG